VSFITALIFLTDILATFKIHHHTSQSQNTKLEARDIVQPNNGDTSSFLLYIDLYAGRVYKTKANTANMLILISFGNMVECFTF